MRPDMIVVLLVALGLCSLFVDQRRLQERVRMLRHKAPVDPATGLLSRSTFEQRALAETRRVDRFGGAIHVWVAEVAGTAEDVDRAGAALQAQIQFPQLGFRLDERLLCVLVPEQAAAPSDADGLRAQIETPLAAAVAGSGWGRYEGGGAALGDVLASVFVPVIDARRRSAA